MGLVLLDTIPMEIIVWQLLLQHSPFPKMGLVRLDTIPMETIVYKVDNKVPPVRDKDFCIHECRHHIRPKDRLLHTIPTW